MIDVTAGGRGPATASDLRTLTLISTAHFVSHFHILVLPMLFPFLKDALGADYLELGFALTLFACVSALTQAPVGYLVDRVGARRILVLGLALGGTALALLAATLSYRWLIVCAILLGLANAVYHPAGYALLTANIGGARIGRAFSIHTFAGYLGSAVAPAGVAALLAALGGPGALLASGGLGLAVALTLVVLPVPEASAARQSRDGTAEESRSMLTPTVLLLVLFFALYALSINGIGSFGLVALMSGYDAAAAFANAALSGYLGAAALGVLAGGLLADRVSRHGQVASVCFGINAVIVGAVALTSPAAATLVAALTLAGFLSGVIAPSRDMLVRKAAPPGAAGRMFGIVSTGFNIGGIISPLLYGWIMDVALPRWVFGASALFMLLTVALTLFTDRRARTAG